MSHAHAARGGMSCQLSQQTPKQKQTQSAKQPDLFRQPQMPVSTTTMITTAKSQSPRNLPTIPSLEVNRGTVSYPSLQAEISSLSLDDASSSPSLPPLTPCRNRSHAIDLMGFDLSCLKCNDDVSTGEHYLKAGQCKILHPPHHRKMSSSSCVAFAVEAALAEQDEAAMSEKAADDDNDDDDSEIFGSDDFTSSCASDLESETSRLDIPNRDDDFSFFQEYSCDCLDSSSCIVKSKSNRDGDDDDDNDDDDNGEGTNSHLTTTDTGTPNGNGDKKVAIPLPPLPSNTPRTPRKHTQRLPKVSADLSPVSVADTNITSTTLHVSTTANTAA